MSEVYGVMKKYGLMISSQEYETGAVKMMIETPEGVFATRDGANMGDLKESDIEKLSVEKLPLPVADMKAVVYSQTPACSKALREARPFKACLDDMAQVFGHTAYIADGRDKNKAVGKSIGKALKGNVGCMVLRGFDKNGKGAGYTLTMGRNLYEAVVAMTVLEKSAEIHFLSEKIGGGVPIAKWEAKLMRLIYKKKYSKAEEKVKAAETVGSVDASSDIDIMAEIDDREKELRQILVEYGKKLVECGLVQGTWGNLSIRLNDKYMLTTPSGLDYMRLSAADMVKVEIENLKYEGDKKPTSEKGLHAAIYRQRPEIGAVIHTHSKYASVFAAARKDMPVESEFRDVFGDSIKLAEYALPGTKALVKNTALAVGNNMGAIMSNHGMIACGADIEQAFDNCVSIEENGKRVLYKK